MSWSSKWSLSLWLSHQYPICISLLPHSCYRPHLSHPSWLDHSNYTWRRVQVKKLLIIQFSPTSCQDSNWSHALSFPTKMFPILPFWKWKQLVPSGSLADTHQSTCLQSHKTVTTAARTSNLMYVLPHLPHLCYMPRPSHLCRFYIPNRVI
jgi:hypothetical protein